MVNGIQIRAARSAIGLLQSELAKEAGITRATLTNLEACKTLPHAETMTKLIALFEGYGVSFFNEDEGFGIRILPGAIAR